jgi:hypothetical protein
MRTWGREDLNSHSHCDFLDGVLIMLDEPDEMDASDAGEPPKLFWKLMEAIERGSWPLEIRFGIEAVGLPKKLRFRSTILSEPEDAAEPEAPRGGLWAVCRLSREKVQAMVVDRIRAARRAGQGVLVSLCLLSRLDRACFLELAAESFADLLQTSTSQLSQEEPLAGLVVDLHEVDPELVPQLVAHTIGVDPVAGERLRSLLLDALADPACADQLGLLTVHSLCERLEEV